MSVLVLFFSSGVLAVSNPSSNWQAHQPTFDKLYSGDFENYWPILNDMKNDQCNATTDFVIGIPPGGCSPSVVRSDLLAEQNVPVFCQLYAIKVNPLIKVSSIKSISFKGDYPEGVRSVVFHPARAAVKSYTTLLGNPTLENVGYVVIILKQEKVEADMEEWIAGNLTATMKYDAEDAYGTGKGDYYLEPMSDEEWDRNYMSSAFWNGRGFLRVLDIGDGKAKIQVMESRDKVLRTLTLKEGETSSSSYLPGFYCKAGLKVKLTDITTQEDMARLNIDGQTIWVRKGSKFLDGKCRVRSLDVRGNNDGEIRISCSGSGGVKTLVLRGAGVMLKTSGDKEITKYNIGDKTSGDKFVLYYGVYPERGEVAAKEFAILVDSMPKDGKVKSIKDELKSSSDFDDFKKRVGKIGLNDVSVLSDENEGLFGGIVSDIGEAETKDVYFDKSVEVVRDELVAVYGSEEKEISGTWAEEALYEEIVLAGELGKFVTQKELMDLFLKRYPLAKTADYIRDMRAKLEGTDYSESFVSIYVGDEFKSISVVDFKAVAEGEKRVDLRVGTIPYANLSEKGKDEFKNEGNGVDLEDDRQIEIREILPGKVKVYFNSKKKDVKSKSATINEGDSEVFDGIRVYVDEVRVNQVAHVSLIPDIKHERSEADFTFRIGIEKRAIELSPERAERMIRSLDVSIEKWEGIVERLGNVVTGLKGACFATSAVLMISNMASGISGKAAARTKVMGEYKRICDSDERYREMSRTECYNGLSKKIDADVVAMTAVLTGANAKMEEVQEKHTADSGGIFGGEHIPEMEKYEKDLIEEVKKGGGLTGEDEIKVKIGDKFVNVPVSELDSTSKIRAVLTWQEARGKGIVENVTRAEMDDVLRNVALSVKAKEDSRVVAERLKGKWNVTNIGAGDVALLTDKDTRYYQWSGKKGSDYGVYGEHAGAKVHAVEVLGGYSYLVVLGDEATSGKMGIEKVLKREEKQWKDVTKDNVLDRRNIAFLSRDDSKDCSNPWSKGKARVSYYELGENKGLPAIVPFDLRDGWYAMVSNSGGTFIDDSPQGYTASADVRYFKICNIGSNKFMQSGTGDDLCQSFDVNSVGKVDSFIPCPGMKSSEVSTLHGKAREAIRRASQQYGEKSVNIFDEMIEVGAPMSQVGGFECQDFMSPSNCKLIFNVCDPVICPPSRCDFGGKFPVSDVIQTGIIGSLALCLPNAKEGIAIPICLSGVHAGLDAYLSILKSEKECLQHSLESGELVGICDEISSIYKCEFFWRQLSPLMDQLIPGMIDYLVVGSRVRGGGEYALVQQSWNSMKNSVSYFKNVYAQNAFRAFNIRSTQEVGSSICKAFIGTSVPGSANFLESLLEPESPSQFYAQFSENLFTEATVPSTSQYKVYYHIYAGNDQGVQYKVYLKNPPQTSYYAANPEVQVKSGYIAAGSSADESIDFTAPSGYKELCVVINAQEECGFKQVTSSFGLDYLSKKHVEEQALEEGIMTERECISGSPSALSMAQLNLQAGVEEVISPEIAMRGIVRVCASINPEAGVTTGDWVVCAEDKDCGTGFKCGEDKYCESKSDEEVRQRKGSRWKDVGYCGDMNLRCWLDVDSVKDDLEVLEVIDGASISVLDERRGLINNTRLDLEGVAKLLSKAREDIEQMSGIRNQESEYTKKGLRIVEELDRVIGNESQSGAGTNGDRAEALALKASVYRLLVGKGVEVGEPVIESREPVIGIEEEDVEEGVAEIGCERFCDEQKESWSKFGKMTGRECLATDGIYNSEIEGGCCCYNEERVAEEEDVEEIKDYIAGAEGKENTVYEINEEKHIGIGHKFTSESRDIFLELFDCDVACFDDIIASKRDLTDSQIEELFDRDIVVYIKRTKGLFSKYDSYPNYVKMALVSSVYRGEMKSEHKTVRLINGELGELGEIDEKYDSIDSESKRWYRVALEYINREDYRKAKEMGLSGIQSRMDANKDLFERYAKELM
ncbi:hypothetical protein KAT36_04275 [Candidatus Pacearchaeota archaeon]|nr:hypothetical protein [Candidatus Pacearchaeota archaeon]